MGFFGECVITTIDFEKRNESLLKPIATNKIFVYEKPTFFSWQAIDPDKAIKSRRYLKLAEGLMVDAFDSPLRDLEPYNLSVSSLGQQRYRFEFSYRKQGSDLLYHLVLPEYCYLDEDEIHKMKNEKATIFTHEKRQCITLAFTLGSEYLELSIGFIGPDEDRFNQIRNEPQPIVFATTEDKRRGGIPIPGWADGW
jgi:hypothetical protein